MQSDALELTIKLLLRFEGIRLKAYQDCVGVWTCGVGDTLGVTKSTVWTEAYAMQRLHIRAQQFMALVLQKCPQLSKESPQRIASCVSLAYNIGVQAFGISSVCRLTNHKEYNRASQSFALWNKAGGKVVSDLTWRRAQEAQLYLS
jgi:lysozyme